MKENTSSFPGQSSESRTMKLLLIGTANLTPPPYLS